MESNYSSHNALLSVPQTTMASLGQEASTASSNGDGEGGERKNPAVSFGFTKTVSKFKSSASGAIVNTDEKDYLTGIDSNEPQR